MKRGVVYDSREKTAPVEVGKMIIWLKSIARFLQWGGTALIVIAVTGLVIIYWPLAGAEITYYGKKNFYSKKVPQVNDLPVLIKKEATITPEPMSVAGWRVPDEMYSINIPKIQAVSKVIPEVDAGNSKIYLAALQKGVAEAKGLAHPGEKGTTYLFAHSVGDRIDYARYNAVFYLLDKLEAGDKVEIVYRKQLFRYQVSKMEILEPRDVKYLIPQNQEERLVMQTCYPPGTTWKRLVWIAQRAE